MQKEVQEQRSKAQIRSIQAYPPKAKEEQTLEHSSSLVLHKS
jgi:hypothetical protein